MALIHNNGSVHFGKSGRWQRNDTSVIIWGDLQIHYKT